MEERLLYEKRQWGEYHVLHERVFPDGIGILTKELVIEAGKSISYQRHFHRDEYWTIVDGQGEIIIDGVRQSVKRGDTFIIRKGQLHTIRANGSHADCADCAESPIPQSESHTDCAESLDPHTPHPTPYPPLTIIEVQMGDFLSETDIERLPFEW